MKNKKYGFTLIELLATIVVIAILSLIIVPVVTGIIENSRKITFLRSAEKINEISKNYYIQNVAKFSNIEEIEFNCDNKECINEDLNNEKINLKAEGAMGDGYVKIYKKGKVEFLLSNGKYCAAKYPNKEEVKIYKGTCDDIVIDVDKVKIENLTYVSTTNSIFVKVEASAGKSGISGYQFAIDGNWTSIIETTNTSYEYPFMELTEKNHTIKVRAYNGTHGKENEDESTSMAEAEIDASLLDFGDITITPSSRDWETSKTYTISGTTEGAQLEYMIKTLDSDKNEWTVIQDWTNYSSAITVDWESTINTPTSIYARFNDGVNTSDEIIYTETKIDTTVPTVSYSVAGGTYNSNQTVRVTVTDENFQSMAVLVFKNKALVYEGKVDSKSIDNTVNNTFDVSPDSDGTWTIYTLAYDKAGNKQNQNPNNGEWYYQEYTIDTIKPTITYNYAVQSVVDWYGGVQYMGCFNGGITPTLTLADTGGSGLSSNNQVLVWKDDTWPNNAVSIGNNQWNIPMTEEGRYIPHIIARDNAGNVSDGTRSDGNHLTAWDIDTSTPTMSVNFNGYTPGTWTNGNISISLIGANTGCEISKNYYYSINDGNWIYLGSGDTATYNITSDANYNIKFLVTDGFGRWGNQTGNYQILRDTTIPTVSYSIAGGTYNSNQTVRVTVSDTNYSSMAVHVYKNSALVYSGKVDAKSTNSTTSNTFDVSLDSDGTWTIYTLAYDKAGNKQNQNPNNGNWYYQEYTIDTTAPTISYSVAGGTYDSNQTVRVTASDDNYNYMAVHVYKNSALVYSGKVDSKSTNSTTSNTFDVSLDSDGTWTIYTLAYDKAGNKQNQNPNNGTWYYQEYTIDTTDKVTPVATIGIINGANKDNGWVGDTNSINFNLKCTVGKSGVASYEYTVYDLGVTDYQGNYGLVDKKVISTNATQQTHLYTSSLSQKTYTYSKTDIYGNIITSSRNVTGPIKVEITCTNGEGNKSAVVSKTVQIDTKPTVSLAKSTTTNSITATTTASSSSGISKYEFKIDSNSWIDNGTSNTYTFDGLSASTSHTIYTRVTNNVGLTSSTSLSVSTSSSGGGSQSGNCHEYESTYCRVPSDPSSIMSFTECRKNNGDCASCGGSWTTEKKYVCD